jgi:hypothetical protein
MNGAATQIASREFDGDFLQMPLAMQANIQRKIDERVSPITVQEMHHAGVMT